ncbi:disks large homolog 2-like [Megalops cyprinoides]|uniref:disks large homolog 2-like n=1 Tax=Megalops cyprinoides TaxID=118141 RepID=UPI001864CD26|nr:disks large homolog 2-like [Megalops cyprinoides]
MSPIVSNDSCFSPVLCHFKAGCSNRTLSLMFGCKNRPAAVQGCPHPPQPVCMHPGCMNPALMSSPWYHYQDEDSLPQDHGYPRLTHEPHAPELVHVTEKSAPEIENVHGYATHSHVSPLKHSVVTRSDLSYPSLTAGNYPSSIAMAASEVTTLMTPPVPPSSLGRG